jgi:hypothetical protein
MRRTLVVAIAAVVALTSGLAFAQQVPSNSTPRNVENLLGMPSTVVVNESTTTWKYEGARRQDVTFTNGRVRVASIDGTGHILRTAVVYTRSNDSTYHAASCPKLRGYITAENRLSDLDLTKYEPDPDCRHLWLAATSVAPVDTIDVSLPPGLPARRGLAVYNLRQSHFDLALRMATGCLALKSDDKDCLGVQRAARPKFLEATRNQLQTVEQNDVYERREI